MQIITGAALREALEGCSWQELDDLMDVSVRKLDIEQSEAIVTEMECRGRGVPEGVLTHALRSLRHARLALTRSH